MPGVEVHLTFRGEIARGDDRHLVASRVLAQATTQAARWQEGGELALTTLPGAGAWALEVSGD